MAFRLLLYFSFFFLPVFFTSCVSKKKYAELKDLSSKTNSVNDIRIKNINNANDSLKIELVKKDSVIDSLNIKIAELNSKKEKPKVYASKKSGSISKGQEYERKSQFVYNFAAYIEWPVIFNGTEFVMGIAGDKEVVKKIQQTIGNKKVGGKKLRIEQYNKVTNYHVVYVTSANSNDFANIKNDSKKNKTILISDDDALFAAGAHISFIMDEDKIRYNVNKPSIEKIGLKVSQELMRFSE